MQKKGTATRSSVKMMAGFGNTEILSNEEWDKMIEESKNGPVMVNFTGPLSEPTELCELMSPVVDKITEEWAGKLKVYVFDATENFPRVIE